MNSSVFWYFIFIWYWTTYAIHQWRSVQNNRRDSVKKILHKTFMFVNAFKVNAIGLKESKWKVLSCLELMLDGMLLKFLQTCRYTGMNVLEVIQTERQLLVLSLWNYPGRREVKEVDIPALVSPWRGRYRASGFRAICKQYVRRGQKLKGLVPSNLWSFSKANLCWQCKKTWKWRE